MDEKNFDWLECCIFLMIANSECTDHLFTEDEITTILDRANMLAKTFAAEHNVIFTEEDVSNKFNMVFDYYNTIGEEAPQGKMDSYIMNKVYKIANYLKQQKLFTKRYEKHLLADLMIIAEADDEFDKNEKIMINEIAKIFNNN